MCWRVSQVSDDSSSSTLARVFLSPSSLSFLSLERERREGKRRRIGYPGPTFIFFQNCGPRNPSVYSLFLLLLFPFSFPVRKEKRGKRREETPRERRHHDPCLKVDPWCSRAREGEKERDVGQGLSRSHAHKTLLSFLSLPLEREGKEDKKRL